MIVMTHRPSTLQAVNKVLVLDKGAQSRFGDKDEVLRPSREHVLGGNQPQRLAEPQSQSEETKDDGGQETPPQELPTKEGAVG